jgi:hypothetical protein
MISAKLIETRVDGSVRGLQESWQIATIGFQDCRLVQVLPAISRHRDAPKSPLPKKPTTLGVRRSAPNNASRKRQRPGPFAVFRPRKGSKTTLGATRKHKSPVFGSGEQP